jgi:hypothetical protein
MSIEEALRFFAKIPKLRRKRRPFTTWGSTT